MILDKRQIPYNPSDSSGLTTTSGVYYKEWAIFAAVVLFTIITIILIRASGRKRITQNLPLHWYQKFFFPRAFRNGPPYVQEVMPLGNVYHAPASRFGRHHDAAGVVPPPPSYDPYATNLPAYQAKSGAEVGASEMLPPPPPPHLQPSSVPGHATEEYHYTIPESTRR